MSATSRAATARCARSANERMTSMRSRRAGLGGCHSTFSLGAAVAAGIFLCACAGKQDAVTRPPPLIHGVYHSFYIVLPLYDASANLRGALQSIFRQVYPVLEVVAIDDMSSDDTFGLLTSFAEFTPHLNVLRTGTRCGLYCAVFTGLQHVKKAALPNDLVMVLQLHDALNPNALNALNEAFVQQHCWASYEPPPGAAAAATAAAAAAAGAAATVQPSHESGSNGTSTWVYRRPLTFKVFLLDLITAGTAFREGFNKHWSWNSEADCDLFLTILEVAGAHTCSVPTALPDGAAAAEEVTLPPNFWLPGGGAASRAPGQQAPPPPPPAAPPPVLTCAAPPGLRLHRRQLRLHVFVCSWKRLAELALLVSSLGRQKIGRQVVVHVVNNHPPHDAELRHILRATPRGRNIAFGVTTRPENGYSFARLEHARDVFRKDAADYFVFLDDDLVLPETFLADLVAAAKPASFICWYGKVFGGRGYWAPAFTTGSPSRNASPDVTEFDYCGAPGSIIDAALFRLPHLLAVPPWYWNLDDVWLSYVVHLAGWRNRRHFVLPYTAVDTNTSRGPAMWTDLGERKEVFLQLLRSHGAWGV